MPFPVGVGTNAKAAKSFPDIVSLEQAVKADQSIFIVYHNFLSKGKKAIDKVMN
jgi:hypothetical protein